MPSLEAMVQELHDGQAIRDCLVRYCRGVDRLDRELIVSCYHEDAVDDHGLFVGSPTGFADWVIPLHAKAQHTTQHIITNHTCELDGDVAHAETYWMFAGMNTQGPPLMISGGRYIDRFERRGGKWAIALRKCVSDWRGVPGEGFLPPAAREAMNSGARTTRDKSDPSYERPLSFDPARMGYLFQF